MITFDGVDLTDYVVIQDVRRGVAPSKNIIMQSVSGMKGSHFSRAETDVYYAEVDFIFIENSLPELRKAVRAFSQVVNTDTLRKIVFHDEPDLYYYGILSGESQLQEVVYTGAGTLTFVMPDPVAYGKSFEKQWKLFSNSLTFKRESTAMQGVSNTVVGVDVPRYELSNFGQAILIEDEVTNLFTGSDNLSTFEIKTYTIGTQGCAIADGVATVSFTRLEEEKGDNRITAPEITVSKDKNHFISFDLQLLQGEVELNFSGTAVDDMAESVKKVGTIAVDGSFTGLYGTRLLSKELIEDGWYRYNLLLSSSFFTKGSGNVARFQTRHGWSSPTVVEYKLKRPMISIGTQTTSYTNGSKASEVLAMPTAQTFNPNEGSWEHRFYVNGAMNRGKDTDRRYIFHIPTKNEETLLALSYLAGSFTVHVGSTTKDFLLKEGWNEVALSWNSEAVYIVINGSHEFTLPVKLPTNSHVSLSIGSKNGLYQSNTLHDAIRLSTVFKPVSELVSDYNKDWIYSKDTDIVLDFNNNIDIQAYNYETDNAIVVDGTECPYPVLKIESFQDIDTFKFTLNDGEYLYLDMKIKAGDIIEIDCNTNNVSVNGERALKYLSLDSRFFALDLGLNTMTLTDNLSATVTISYFERWR